MMDSSEKGCEGKKAVTRKKAKRLKKAVERLKGCYHFVTAFWPNNIPMVSPHLSNTKEFPIKSPFNLFFSCNSMGVDS